MIAKLVKNYHFTIQKKYVNKKLSKLNYVSIKIRKNRKTEQFLIKLLHRKHGPIEVVMPKFVRNSLSIKISDNFEILEIRPVRYLKTPSQLIKGNYVDLLFLIPKKMNNGKNIIIDYNKGYVRLWGLKCQEIKLKRFVKVNIIGKLFGLIQAESAKHGNKFDFSNIFYTLHKEFLSLLNCVTDIKNINFKCYLGYNPRIGKKEAVKKSIEFLKITKLSLYKLKIVKNPLAGDIPPVELCIFNKLFNEVFLGILNNLRFYLANRKLNGCEKALAEFFISKLLTGDGTVMLHKRKGHFTPYIKLFDIVPFLEIYKKILFNLGIDSRIDEKRFELRLLCDWNTAVYLFNIGAFDGHKINRGKLLEAIINHRKTKSLMKLESFENGLLTFDGVAELFNNNTFATKYWLNNMFSEGYLKCANNKYLLMKKGESILDFIHNLNNKW